MADYLGTIALLQVHRSAVKANARYDPSPLLSVEKASFDAGGMIGWDGSQWVMDNHHREYPGNQGGWRRALSVGFTAHYAAMEDRFGGTVFTGIAGENVIIAVDEVVTLDDLGSGIELHSGDGRALVLEEPLVAAPCREFTSCLLALPERAERDEIRDHLDFLDDGMRGYVFGSQHLDEPVVISVGAEVFVTS